MQACSPNLVADINHLEQIQRLAARLVTGIRHLPYEARLQRRRLWADLISAFKIFTGLFNIDPNLLFLPPARRGLGGLPYKVRQGASYSRRRGLAFSVGLWKTEISSRLPSLQFLLSMFSRKGWKMFGQKSFPISPIDWTLIYPPIPPAPHPLTVIISICYPTPCSIYVVSSGPLWPTFCHYKS